MKMAIVIMAAGQGTRLKSNRPKVLHEVGGQPLVAHVISAACRLVAAEDVYVIVGHQAQRVQDALASTGVRFVHQTEQRGTGHALQCAVDAIRDYDNVLVLSGDVPLIRTETIEQVWNFHQSQQAAMTLLTAVPADPTGYGRVLRRSPDSPEVARIIEQRDLTADQLCLREINSGIYAFRTAPLFDQLGKLQPNNAQGELYLTDVAGLLSAAGQKVVAIEAADANEILGANTIAELVALDQALRTATARRLMDSGVTILRPDTCVIDAQVHVEPDVIIEPFVQILGKSRIAAETRIRSYSVIENCLIGSGVLIRQSCILSDSTIADGARIGPFSHVRPGSTIGNDAHVGNFVEIKKSTLGTGAKANHLAYIGDAEIGERTNIGAGTITCNYDGVNKHLTRIGKGVFVGSNSTLIAPVTVGDGAYIGAASCISKDIPADALAVGRARQLNKDGWAKAKRARTLRTTAQTKPSTAKSKPAGD